MQSFIVFTLLVTVATAASIGSSQQGVVHNVVHTLTEEGNINANAPSESARLKKSTYGSAPVSVPAPPCPKNYLFSCQPNIAPVPCASAQSGYAGAYSAPVPTYAYPQAHRGIPQELLRQYYY